MSTSTLALSISALLVVGLVVGLAMTSLLLGALERYWGTPKLSLLRSQKGERGFAFCFQWNESKEPVHYAALKLCLFNPFGRPSRVELFHPFNKTGESFALDLDMGEGFSAFTAQGLDRAQIEVELESPEGVNFRRQYRAENFKQLRESAQQTVGDLQFSPPSSTLVPKENFWTVNRDFIADTVPGKGAQVALPTNPAFTEFFQGAGGGGRPEAVEAQENFAVTKVWIEDGCIVCNACEDIYPEVFKVIADGCEVHPGHPTDDGLRVEEAAEACPVEIIKFAKA